MLARKFRPCFQAEWTPNQNPACKSMAFMLVADDDARDHANLQKTLKLIPQWEEAGCQVISMKNDFKTIYGDRFIKTDFEF